MDSPVLKANRLLGMIRRSIEVKTKDIILPLYTTLIRPHLEYCVQAWRPYYCKDIDKLERVQKRAVKMIIGLHSKCYKDKLFELGLFSLEKRRIRGDLITVFRILKGIDHIDSKIFFKLFQVSNQTRGHSLKLAMPRFKTDVRKYFFSSRVVSLWNALPDDVIRCKTVSTFKTHLDKSPAFLQLL